MAKSPTASSRGAQVMFDYPTVADLTDFIVAQFSEGDDDAEGALGGDWEDLRAKVWWNQGVTVSFGGRGEYFKSS